MADNTIATESAADDFKPLAVSTIESALRDAPKVIEFAPIATESAADDFKPAVSTIESALSDEANTSIEKTKWTRHNSQLNQ